MTIERRKAERVKKHLMVKFQDPCNTEHWDLTEILDFSETGLVIATEKVFEANTILCLRIKLPTDPLRWYEFNGRVVMCEKWRVRIEISKITPETKDMIRQYIAWCLSKERGES